MKTLFLIVYIIIFIGSCKPGLNKNDQDNLNRLASLLSASSSPEPKLRITGNARGLNNKSLPNTVMRMDSKRLSTNLNVKNDSTEPPPLPQPKGLRFVDYSLSPNKLKGTVVDKYDDNPIVHHYELFWINTSGEKLKKFVELQKDGPRFRYTFGEMKKPGDYDQLLLRKYNENGGLLQVVSTKFQDTKDGAITDKNGNFTIYCTHSKLYTIELADVYLDFGNFKIDLSTATSASDLSNISEDVAKNGVESFVNQYVVQNEGFILTITGVFYEGPTPNQTEYSIGGSIAGLSSDGLVLQNNGGDDLSLTSGSTNFTFSTKVSEGNSYNVTVATQPNGQTCTVTNGSGTATNDVANVAITCSGTTCSGSSVVRPWATFNDCNDGTIEVVVNNGTWGGATYSAQTLYFAKCNYGQTWNSGSNDCTGTGNAGNHYGSTEVQYCTTGDNSCDDGTVLNGSGISSAWSACSGSSLTGKSWRVPTLNELRLLMNCDDPSEFPANPGDQCTSFSTPSTNDLFPNTVSTHTVSSSSFGSNAAGYVNFGAAAYQTNQPKTDSTYHLICISDGP